MRPIGEALGFGCSGSSDGSGRSTASERSGGRESITALAAHRQLDDDEIEEIAARIDAQQAFRQLRPISTTAPARATSSSFSNGGRAHSTKSVRLEEV